MVQPPPPPPPAPPAWDARPSDLPARKRRLTWVWILIPVLLVFTASSLVVITFGVRFFTEPFDASNQYLAALRAGRYSEAYSSLCTHAQRDEREFFFTQEARKTAREQGRISAFDIDDWSFPVQDEVPFIDRVTSGTIVRGNDTYNVRIYLAHEDGAWKVCQMDESHQRLPRRDEPLGG